MSGKMSYKPSTFREMGIHMGSYREEDKKVIMVNVSETAEKDCGLYCMEDF